MCLIIMLDCVVCTLLCSWIHVDFSFIFFLLLVMSVCIHLLTNLSRYYPVHVSLSHLTHANMGNTVVSTLYIEMYVSVHLLFLFICIIKEMKSGDFIEWPVIRDWFNLKVQNFNQKSSHEWMMAVRICVINLLIHFYQCWMTHRANVSCECVLYVCIC